MRCCSHLSLQALNCLVYVVRYTIKVFGLLTAVVAAELTDHAAADTDRHIRRDIAVSAKNPPVAVTGGNFVLPFNLALSCLHNRQINIIKVYGIVLIAYRCADKC